MRVLVVGGGVIGVTTAWTLATQGAEVELIERHADVAMETSFANAGQISPGYAAPWAAPGVPLKVLRWLCMKHSPVGFRFDGSFAQLRWLGAFLGNCNAVRYARNKARMQRLAEYSRDCLDALRLHLDLGYEGRSLGTLQVFREERQLAGAERDIAVLGELGVAHRLLDRAGLRDVEPALSNSQLLGGLYLPGDETGDCRLFTSRLAARAAQGGVRFHLETQLQKLIIESARVRGAWTSAGPLLADRVVLATGVWSPAWMPFHLPVYPVKGYSLTARLHDKALAPRSTVLDETYKVAVTRFEHRLRVGGMAEVAGFDRRLEPRRQATLAYVADALFPGAADLERAMPWSGLRPMTPDGTPYVCATPIDGLYLNTGHGTLGWTMACGAAALITDLLLGRPTSLPAADYSLGRAA